MKRFRLRTSLKGATQLGFVDVVTAIVVLAILVYAASRQFPVYHGASSSTAEPSQAH